jgi:hypothetical protein
MKDNAPLPELHKGNTLTLEVTRALVPYQPETPRYALGLLALRTRIEQHFWRQAEDVTVVVRGQQLHICTDAEASVYNLNRTRHHAEGIKFREKKLRNVAMDSLTQSEKQDHARRMAYAAMLAAGVRKSMKDARRSIDLTVEASAE